MIGRVIGLFHRLRATRLQCDACHKMIQVAHEEHFRKDSPIDLKQLLTSLADNLL